MTLVLLLVAATAYFTANMAGPSLPPSDDCFYARKGVEMWQRSAFFVVTWNNVGTPQNPPLQFWLLGRCFAVLGENDLAARLPSALMALGVLLLAYRIGCLTVGRPAALAGMALLLSTPVFLQNAGRCMLEIPTCFWQAALLWLALEARARPRLAVLLCLPLTAGLWTKSLLGLLPVAVLAVWLWHEDFRSLRRSGWLWAGVVLGIMGGAWWPVRQGLVLGWWTLRMHYVDEIGSRAASGFDVVGFLFGYPRILMQHFQPVVLPGLVGAVVAVRDWRAHRSDRAVLLAVWIVVTLVLCNFSSERSGRYVFAILVPLALLAGRMLVGWKPTLVRHAVRWVVPALLLVGAVVWWVSPRTLTRDVNASFKKAGPEIAVLLPERAEIPLLGEVDWGLANSLLYYGQHAPGPICGTVDEVVEAARSLPRVVFVTRKERLQEVYDHGFAVDVLFELREWVIAEIVEEVPVYEIRDM